MWETLTPVHRTVRKHESCSSKRNTTVGDLKYFPFFLLLFIYDIHVKLLCITCTYGKKTEEGKKREEGEKEKNLIRT